MDNEGSFAILFILGLILSGIFMGGMVCGICECRYRHRYKKNHRLYPEYYTKINERNDFYLQSYKVLDKVNAIKKQIDGLIKQLDYTPIEYQDNMKCTIESLRREVYPLEQDYEQRISQCRELDEWITNYRKENNIKE